MAWTWLSQPEEIREAIWRVRTWGYSRELTEDDEHALWFGRHGLYLWVELCAAGELHGVVHCCRDMTMPFFGRDLVLALDALPRLLGCHVWALEVDLQLPGAVVGYLQRLGFCKTDLGWVRGPDG